MAYQPNRLLRDSVPCPQSDPQDQKLTSYDSKIAPSSPLSFSHAHTGSSKDCTEIDVTDKQKGSSCSLFIHYRGVNFLPIQEHTVGGPAWPLNTPLFQPYRAAKAGTRARLLDTSRDGIEEALWVHLSFL